MVGIEGLRGVAAVSVIAGHVSIHLAPGVDLRNGGKVVGNLHHGLTLFFALSGFLLFRPFAASLLAGTPRPPVGRFFRNRALRIFPAYVVIFLISSYVLQTTYVMSTNDSGVGSTRGSLGPITDPLDVLANLTMVHTLIPSTVKTGLGVSWSLTTELTFYMALPILAGVALWLRRRGVHGIAAALFVPGALLATALVGKAVAESTLSYSTPGERFFQLWGANWHAVLERSLLVQADLFAYGTAAAVLFVLAEQRVIGGAQVHAVRLACGAVVLGTVALLLTHGLPWKFGTDRWQDSWMAAASACLILLAALPTRSSRPSRVGAFLELKPVAYTGLVSYSLYLWHLPVLWWLATHGLVFRRSPAGFLGNVLVVVGVTYALSVLTYHFVEKPALRRKKRTDRGDASEAPEEGASPRIAVERAPETAVGQR